MGHGETNHMRLPLEDVTVIDLSHALAGPFCSTMLADFGARVIKLEPKGAGDIARAWGTPLPGGETAYFASLHRNKQGIEVDLKHPGGKELFFELVARADVVLENYRTGALERLGLAYAEACRRNPGVIYCSVSGFGQDGPYRDRAALDLILQAESGMISVTGEEGGRGVRAGTSQPILASSRRIRPPGDGIMISRTACVLLAIALSHHRQSRADMVSVAECSPSQVSQRTQ